MKVIHFNALFRMSAAAQPPFGHDNAICPSGLPVCRHCPASHPKEMRLRFLPWLEAALSVPYSSLVSIILPLNLKMQINHLHIFSK